MIDANPIISSDSITQKNILKNINSIKISIKDLKDTPKKECIELQLNLLGKIIENNNTNTFNYALYSLRQLNSILSLTPQQKITNKPCFYSSYDIFSNSALPSLFVLLTNIFSFESIIPSAYISKINPLFETLNVLHCYLKNLENSCSKYCCTISFLDYKDIERISKEMKIEENEYNERISKEMKIEENEIKIDDYQEQKEQPPNVLALGLLMGHLQHILSEITCELSHVIQSNFSKLNSHIILMLKNRVNNLLDFLKIAETADIHDVFLEYNTDIIEIADFSINEKARKILLDIRNNIMYSNAFVGSAANCNNQFSRILFMIWGSIYFGLTPENAKIEGAYFASEADINIAKEVWNLPDSMAYCCFYCSFPSISVNETFKVPSYVSKDPPIPVRLLGNKHPKNQNKCISTCCPSLYNIFFPYLENNENECIDLILHCHGGGFISMSSFSHQNYTRRWAIDTDLPLLSIDYRLAPEHPYPAALNDCYSVYRWLVNNSQERIGKVGRIILVGDSAGGNLITGIVIRCIQDGFSLPHGLILAYPALMLYRLFTPSLIKTLHDPIIPYRFIRLCSEAYCGHVAEDALSDPYLCPLLSPDEILSQFPPTRIMSGTEDPIHDHSLRFVSRLKKLGVDANAKIYKGLPHGFLNYDSPILGLTDCRQCVNQGSEWIKELLGR